MIRLPSFRSLLVAGFFIVAGIPSFALIQLREELESAGAAERQHQQLSRQWQDAARISREQAVQFERMSRQSLILKDAALQRMATAAGEELRQAQLALLQSHEQNLQAGARAILSIQSQLQAGSGLGAAQRDRLFRQLDQGLEQQTQRMSALLAQRQAEWQRTLEGMREKADKRARLSVTAALILALLIAVLLSRPLRRLQGKIARMSDGSRRQDWTLSGPSDLQRLAGELSRLDQRLSTLEEQKGQFFRHVSHELKTPLAAINEAASLLHEEVAGGLNAQQHEIVAILLSSASSLRGRVDALLRYDAGQWLSHELTLRTFSLAALVQERLQALSVILQAKQLRIVVHGDPGAVTGDRSKVETIIDNLLVNASRYSPQAGELSIRLGRDREWVWLEVADQGPGIAAAQADMIFEPFWSGEAPRGESPGSGLGLTMARGFAQLMRGDVTLQASAGGACFRLSWPEPEITA
ncbi:ATP-binding protein [Paludibacterium yongneupense]|uniref:ATP-binding protein n=1 Tax=Paludibacterium yongneupense TaxID=400061 RepID=UPI00146DF3A4|nr:ATP-binding protein [Paludibacterium yongneupense]